MKKLLCAAMWGGFALLMCGPVFADSLSGRVVDPQGAAVANAEVSLLDRTSGNLRKTTTSATGDYNFQNISAGSYLLESQASGATMSGSQDVTVAGDNTQNLTLGIARSTARVLVSATSTPLSEQEIAKVIDVVDLEEINHRDEFSIAESVRNVPGVRVQQLGGPGSFTTIKTRGMRNQDTAVAVDGIRFRDAAGTQGDASGFFEDLTVIDSSRIEYLRGSGSSLYGTNAMAGVINISSNQGGGRPRGSVRVEGGGLGMVRATANIGGGLAQDRFVYSGGFQQLNVTKGVRDRGPYRNTGGQVFGKYHFTDKFSVSGRFWGSDTKLRGQDGPAFPAAVLANFPATGPVKAIAASDDAITQFENRQPVSVGNATYIPSPYDRDYNRFGSFVAAAAIANYQLAPEANYRFSYQGVNTRRSYRDGPLGPGDFEPTVANLGRYGGRTDTIQHRLDARAGRYNLLNMGYEFEREAYDDLNTDASLNAPIASVNIRQHSHSMFGQDQIQLLSNRLQIAVSGRAQFFELSQPIFTGGQNPYTGVSVKSPANAYTGDVSVSYFVPSSRTKLRGHVGNSYRAPSSYERFGAYVVGGFPSFYGDPRLKPEKALAFDGGIDQWLWNDRVRLGATYFYTDLSETIIFTFSNFDPNDPFQRFGGYKNSKGGQIARGAELSAQFSPTSKTNIQVNYTYLNADSRSPQIAGYYGVPGTSNHMFTAVATQWITRRLNATFDFYAVSEYSLSPFGANGRRMVFAGPVKGDIVVNYNLPVGDDRSVDFYGKVDNMFNQSIYEQGYRAPRAWGIGGIKYNW